MAKSPTESLKEAVKCISEAARLHVKMKQHSSKPAIAAALEWRYGLTDWEAQECYDAALLLLDAMPKSR